MKTLTSFFFFIFCTGIIKADTMDHWTILVNGQRVFECPATCSANGVNLNMLKAKVKLKAGDNITIIYIKDVKEPNITKNIIVSDSTGKNSKTFSVYDNDGTHAVTVNVNEFNSIHGILIWYSETKKVNDKEVTTDKVALVYFE